MLKMLKIKLFLYVLLIMFVVLFPKEIYANEDWNHLSKDTLQTLAKMLPCNNRGQRQVFRQTGEYWSLNNFVVAEHGPVACHETITYTTQAEYNYLHNLLPVVTNWLAPVSVAVYAPGNDFTAATDSIRYLRECSNTSLIKKYVSFHLFFPSGHFPEKILSHSEVQDKPIDCHIPPPYKSGKATYRRKSSLIYPINVARNIAVDAAVTYYVLPADVELYPSRNLVPQFLNMIARNQPPLNDSLPKVFVLNIFEMSMDQELPSNKSVLLELYMKGLVAPFEEDICVTCHRTPKREEWLATNETSSLEIFAKTKRTGDHLYWEPTFITTPYESYFDERHTWEGMKDKMSMVYRLCLQNYDFMVLNNAFLIHNPKARSSRKVEFRHKDIIATDTMLANELIPEYSFLFGDRKSCQMLPQDYIKILQITKKGN